MLKATGKLSGGQLHGLWKWYRENGKLYDVGKFVNGEKRGDWKYYDKRGKLIRTKKL